MVLDYSSAGFLQGSDGSSGSLRDGKCRMRDMRCAHHDDNTFYWGHGGIIHQGTWPLFGPRTMVQNTKWSLNACNRHTIPTMASFWPPFIYHFRFQIRGCSGLPLTFFGYLLLLLESTKILYIIQIVLLWKIPLFLQEIDGSIKPTLDSVRRNCLNNEKLAQVTLSVRLVVSEFVHLLGSMVWFFSLSCMFQSTVDEAICN